jgi:hypothetical protein
MNYNYVSHKSIKQNGLLMSQKAGPSWIPKFCLFLWDRMMKMKAKMLLNPVRRPRLFMSTVIQPPTVPGASPSTLLTSDSGSNQKPRGLWPNAHPLDPKCVSIYPRTSQNLKGIEIWKIKILTPPGSEPWSPVSLTRMPGT